MAPAAVIRAWRRHTNCALDDAARALNRGVGFLVLIGIAVSCRHPQRPGPPPDGTATGVTPKPLNSQIASNSDKPAPIESSSLNLLDELSGCEVDQLGPVVEVGTSSELARRGYNINSDKLTQSVDRSGGTFMRIYDRRLTHEFWLEEPMERPRLTLRLVSAGATRLTVRLDKVTVGTTKLTRGEPVTRAFGPIEGIVEPGRHIVSLEFRGQSTDKLEPSAEIDWIHLGQPLDGDTIPTVPTLRSLVADQNIGAVPKRSIVLRAPSSIRCPLLLTTGAHLRVSLGFWGSGSG